MTIHGPRTTGLIAALRRALKAIDSGFCTLNRIRFDAPWRTGPTRC